MVLLLFEPFLEPPPLPPTTKVLEPFEELDIVRVICHFSDAAVGYLR